MTRSQSNNLVLTWIGITVIFCMAIYVQSISLINHDVSWLLHIAQRDLAGEKLMRDLVELNPPLIVWVMAPSAYISGLTGWSLSAVFKGYVLLLAFGSLLLSHQLLRRSKFNNWQIVLAAMAFVMTLYPAWNFGQREHLVVILTLPYLCMIIARRDGVNIPILLVVISAVFGAIGFCIKPYFLLVPALLELYLLKAIGIRNTFRRPEPYILGALVAVYVRLIFWITPDYVANVVPMTIETHRAAFETSWSRLAKVITPPLLLIGVGIMWLRIQRPKHIDALFIVFIIASLGMVCVYFYQARGYQSHVLPAESYVLIGIVGLIISQWKAAYGKPLKESIFLWAIVGLVVANSVPRIKRLNTYDVRTVELFSGALDKHPGVETIYIMSASLSDGFPLVTDQNLNWASRLPSQWLAPGVQSERMRLGGTRPSLDKIEHYYWSATAEDLKKFKPEIVFIEAGNPVLFKDKSYDYISDFSQHPEFRKVWAHYKKVDAIPKFDVYELNSAGK